MRVADPEGHRACGGAMLRCEVRRGALGLTVDDEVDLALPIKRDVLRTMARHLRESEPGEDGLEHAQVRRGELDELEAHESHRVVEEVGHCVAPGCSRMRNYPKIPDPAKVPVGC